MLLEAITWLAQEAFADQSVNRLAREIDKLKPGLGVVVTKVYVGAAAGVGVGKTLGEETAENISQGTPSTVGLDYTPEIQAYDRTAIGSTRII